MRRHLFAAVSLYTTPTFVSNFIEITQTHKPTLKKLQRENLEITR